MNSLCEAKVRFGFPKNVVSFFPCFFFFQPFDNFINNFIVRFIYEDALAQLDFFPGNIYNLVFSDIKKNQIPKILPCGFLWPQSVNKILRFCSWYLKCLNKMSQMPGFCPNNSVPPIFCENNHFGIHLIVMKP